MNTIDGITDAPKQTTALTLDDGTKVTLSIEFRPNQRGWFFDVEREDFIVRGLRLVASPNILRKWRKLVPFGLGVITARGQEPTGQNDFVNGKITLLLLSAADVLEVENFFVNG
jgi:hypothetical protein